MMKLFVFSALIFILSVSANENTTPSLKVIGPDQINELIISKIESNLTNEQVTETQVIEINSLAEEPRDEYLYSIIDSLKDLLNEKNGNELLNIFNITTQKNSSTNSLSKNETYLELKNVRGCAKIISEKAGKKETLRISANITSDYDFKKDSESEQLSKKVSLEGKIKIKNEDKHQDKVYNRIMSIKSESNVEVEVTTAKKTYVKKTHSYTSTHVNTFNHNQCEQCKCKHVGNAFHHTHTKTEINKTSQSNQSNKIVIETSSSHFSNYMICN